MAESLLALVATYLVHSTLLLGGAWLVDASGRVRAPEVREFVWRLALLGAFATTALVSWPRDDAATPSAVTRNVDADRVMARASTVGAASRDVVAQPRFAAPNDAPARTNETPRTFTLPALRARPVLALPRWSVDVATPLAMLIAAIALIALVQLVRAAVRERRASTALPVCDDAVLSDEAHALAVKLGVPSPSVRYTETGEGPYASGATRVCVPRWASDLGADERRGMLAHELAHLARRDPQWRLVVAALTRLAWLQPLNRLAERRLEALAELVCDARAAQALGDGRGLASCLASCAEHLASAVPEFAAAMARRRSALVERIETLIEDRPMTRPVAVFAARAFALATLSIAIGALPAVRFEAYAAERDAPAQPAVPAEPAKPTKPAKPRAFGNESIHYRSSLFGETFEMSSDRLGLEVEIDGDVAFNDSESDVASLDDEASIEQDVGGVERRIEFRNAGGTVARRYFVDGREQRIDAAGRQWLASVIPTVLRESGFDAEARVERIKGRGGVAAVLAEIERISGDYARRAYVTALAERGPLQPAEIDRLIELVEQSSSDFEKRASLTAIVENQKLAAVPQVALLRAVAGMSSDFEQRTVMQSLAPKLVLEGGTAHAWGAALATIDSDFEARVVIQTLAERRSLPQDHVRLALANTAQIDSDFERRTALQDLAPHVERYPALVRDYAASTAEMGSDFERRTAIVTLVEEVPVDAELAGAVLEAIAGIGSDFEKRTALVELAARMPADADLIRRYRQVAREMGDFERGQAEKALDRFEI